MTEEEWLTATNPTPMLEFLRGKASDRKLRMFAVASCIKISHLLTDEPCRRAIYVAEKYADQQANTEDLAIVSEAALWISKQTDRRAATAAYQCSQEDIQNGARFVIELVYEALWTGEERAVQRAIQVDLLRDIFGHPFRQVAFNPSWLTSTVLALTNGIYNEKAFDRMPILADALQDAGCDDEDVLNHCRQPGEHCRGCWVLDLVTGRK
jgi:hypothetical protein